MMEINTTELMLVAKLAKSKRVPPDAMINIFHPAPGVCVAEWLVNAPNEPTGKKWVHYDVGSGKEYEVSVTHARTLKAAETFHEHLKKIETAQEMKAKGYSNAAIAQKMGISESSVRTLLKGD